MGRLKKRLGRLEAKGPRFGEIPESRTQRGIRRIDEEIRRLDMETAAEEADAPEEERRESRAGDDRLANLVGLYGFDHAIRVLEEEIEAWTEGE